MLTGRGISVLVGGLLLWLASRMVGAPALHIVAVGLIALVPLSYVLVRWLRPDLHATRRVAPRRAFPGARVKVDIEVHNRGGRRTSLLLLEDRLPATLGASARAVLGSLPPRARHTVSYHLVPRNRGRFRIGPLSASVTDPFDLARRQVELPGRQELIVFPQVEDLEITPSAPPTGSAGESSTRQLFRSGDEFYTMRSYEIGDDLRRIHWPSTARSGELMIRQDEAARRATAVLFLDTRDSAFASEDPFERAVSAAASIGNHYVRGGYSVRLSTPDLAPRPVGLEELLERLALVGPSRARLLTPALLRLRAAAHGAAALVVVTHVPTPAETAALTRISSGYGPKLAVLSHRSDPDRLYLQDRRDLDRDLEGARTSLARAGWDVLPLPPGARLKDVWQLRTKRPARGLASSW
jgi:uncharacterized protein (DUF58 family)